MKLNVSFYLQEESITQDIHNHYLVLMKTTHNLIALLVNCKLIETTLMHIVLKSENPIFTCKDC